MMKKHIKSLAEKFCTIGRYVDPPKDPVIADKLAQLKARGFVMLDHMVGSSEFKKMKGSIDQKIEQDFELQFPCLSQSKIDVERDKKLIETNFLASNEKLKQLGLTFDRANITSYQQILDEFNPSTLTIPMPSEAEYYQLWLDPNVMSIVSAYMGFKPHMTEGYVRRNFPSSFKIMNHNWHRDTNHDKYLLKAFIFFTDCDIDTGAHHYIAGSINDPRHRDKPYFTDDEIHATWPIGSDDHMISTVPAGTIIIEDTRGLHKAGIPKKAYRDLGYAIFSPPINFPKIKPLYKIKKSTFEQLNTQQQKFIPTANISKNKT
ncbi:MAG: phytanoyl-CoA dioxygenase [Candidatus Puniceispirillales bacterium WSBS_2018_MAG_OTU23]